VAKQHKFIFSRFWRLKNLRSSSELGWLLLRVTREGSVSGLSPWLIDSFCYLLDLECPPQAHVFKTCPQLVVLLEGDRTFRKQSLVGGNRSLWACFRRLCWDPGPFLSFSVFASQSLWGERHYAATCSMPWCSALPWPRYNGANRLWRKNL
jgi:hypothetical protein